MRSGIGYDIHRIVPTVERSALPIGGVAIPCYFKYQSHSDGDVLLHSIVDACLGALALGDIGQWFPDTSEENRGKKSSEFVKVVIEYIHKMGWKVTQVDSVILAEEPKIAPHTDSIRRELALLLKTELSNVSVKAKTNEGLGPVGERKAIAAHALVTLECPSKSPIR